MNDLDNKFKQGLEDFTSLPSPAVWENIEAALDAEQGESHAGRSYVGLGKHSGCFNRIGIVIASF